MTVVSTRRALLAQMVSSMGLSGLATGRVLAQGTGGKPAQAHGLAMIGEPALAAGFPSLPYVNPQAPKGGTLTLGQLDSFDSLNPFIIKGTTPFGVREYVYESLMVRSGAEPFSVYGLIAESCEVTVDRSSITFNLRPEARFSDGVAITAKDVVFTHALLKAHGWPFIQTYYGRVKTIEAESPLRVRYDLLDGDDRELPLILAVGPILPSHLIDPNTFEHTTLETPIGSGPYRLAQVQPGRSLTFKRNPDHWARGLPVLQGRFNFNEITIEFYRDATALFEAFTSGRIDVRFEDDPTRWALAYDVPALREGRMAREEVQTQVPAGLSAFVFNLRRPVFQDVRVRQALIKAFDFDQINRTLYQGRGARTRSVFERSNYSAAGRPADARERELLRPYLRQIKPEILEGKLEPQPSGDGSQARDALKAASVLLDEAGTVLEGDTRVQAESREPLRFEFLAASRAQQRLMLAYSGALAKLGIKVGIRLVDDAQYWGRLKNRDFDMIQWSWAGTLSPGNEQLNRFGSKAADKPGTQNFAGIKSEAADAMIQAMLKAETRDAYVSACRAFDRVIISGDYCIPLFFIPKVWMAYKTTLKRPAAAPLSGVDLETWWTG